MNKTLPAQDLLRERFPYSVPLINTNASVNSWCSANLGSEGVDWLCRKPESTWASSEYRFRDQKHWELFLLQWG
jgi:hypothetical protein